MPEYSALSHLRCSRCGRESPASGVREKCQCGGILFAQYDLTKVAASWSKEILASREPTLWKYHELLPVRNQANVVSLCEQMTPLLTLPTLSGHLDVPNLLVKDESRLPSGTFKARGSSVGISKAKELGVPGVAIPTNGNAGAAWALYAARAGLPITVVLPRSGPETPRKESVAAGARVYTIDGTIGDAGRLVHEAAQKYGWYDVSTFNEPYRLEGKKTMGLEIAEQLGWNVPDVIVYPTGGGAGVVGIYKAFDELEQLGFIGSKRPRMAIIQTEGCAPLARAFEKGARASEPWVDPATIAFGMRVPSPSADYLLLDIVYRTGGICTTVTETAIADMRLQVLRDEGFNICPEGAAAFAGVQKLREQGVISRDEQVLLVNTGSGLKYMDQIADTSTQLDLCTGL